MKELIKNLKEIKPSKEEKKYAIKTLFEGIIIMAIGTALIYFGCLLG